MHAMHAAGYLPQDSQVDLN